jgi:hypothetical protein
LLNDERSFDVFEATSLVLQVGEEISTCDEILEDVSEIALDDTGSRDYFLHGIGAPEDLLNGNYVGLQNDKHT